MKAFKVVEAGANPALVLDNQHPKLGDLDPGSVQRYEAAPDHIGDTAGAIPESSFAGNANANSDLLILSDVLAKGDFEQTGPVLSLDLTGRAVSASSYGQEYKLLGEHQFPACYGGIPGAAITQAMFLGGLWTIQPATPTMEWRYTGFWPLNGTSAGFTLGPAPSVINEEPPAGNLRDHLAPPRPRSRFTARTPLVIRRASGALAFDVDAPFPGVGSLWRGVSSFTVNNLGSAAIGSRVRLTSNAYPDSSDTGNGKTLTVDVVRTSTSAQIVTELRYRVAGIANLVTKTTDLSAIFTASTGGSIQVVIDTSRVSGGANLRIGIAACLITGADYDPVNPPFTVTDNVVAANTPLDPEWTKANIESNGVASITNYFAARVLSSAFPTPVFRVPYPPRPQTGNGYQPNSPYLPWLGPGWDYLKMLMPAQGADYYWNQDGSIRYIENRFYEGPISNPIAPPSVSVDMTRTAKYVEVVNQRTRYIGTNNASTILYQFDEGQAVTSDDRSFDVVYVTSPNVVYEGSVSYSVIGRRSGENTPRNVSQANYEAAGGSVSVIDTGGGVLQLNIAGPGRPIDGITGPYNITKLAVRGLGITTSPMPIRIYTGAPDSIITREAGPTVDNPFIGNAAVARDAGVHLAHAYGTPNVTMSFSEPLGVRSMGWNFYNGWSSFRIDSGSYQRVGPSYVSSISSTVGEHDRDWVAAGQTVGQFDAFQSGKRCIDGDMRALEVPDTINVSLKNYVPFSEEYPSHPKTPPYSIN